MTNKLAKLKYLPNTFEVIEKGDHVICAVSNKKIYIFFYRSVLEFSIGPYFPIRTYFCLRGRPVVETVRKPSLMYYNVNTVTLARTYW